MLCSRRCFEQMKETAGGEDRRRILQTAQPLSCPRLWCTSNRTHIRPLLRAVGSRPHKPPQKNAEEKEDHMIGQHVEEPKRLHDACEDKTPGYSSRLPGKNLHDTITTSADHPPAILAPNDGANSFSTHKPMAGDFLCATPFLQRPETKTSIMTS